MSAEETLAERLAEWLVREGALDRAARVEVTVTSERRFRAVFLLEVLLLLCCCPALFFSHSTAFLEADPSFESHRLVHTLTVTIHGAGGAVLARSAFEASSAEALDRLHRRVLLASAAHGIPVFELAPPPALFLGGQPAGAPFGLDGASAEAALAAKGVGVAATEEGGLELRFRREASLLGDLGVFVFLVLFAPLLALTATGRENLRLAPRLVFRREPAWRVVRLGPAGVASRVTRHGADTEAWELPGRDLVGLGARDGALVVHGRDDLHRLALGDEGLARLARTALLARVRSLAAAPAPTRCSACATPWAPPATACPACGTPRVSEP